MSDLKVGDEDEDVCYEKLYVDFRPQTDEDIRLHSVKRANNSKIFFNPAVKNVLGKYTMNQTPTNDVIPPPAKPDLKADTIKLTEDAIKLAEDVAVTIEEKLTKRYYLNGMWLPMKLSREAKN